MATLRLHLMGPFQALLDGEAIARFSSNKVRALLVYLAVEADRPHSREALATLLWPDWADRAALSNLRYVLSDLRQAIGDSRAQPPFLLITREMVQFNAASDHWVDVPELERQAQAARETHRADEARSLLASCASLYRGSFLEGFSVGDSAAFEEWMSFKREEVARQVQSVLYDLATLHEKRGEYDQALPYARRQLELEPWQEEAHQQVMRLLALSGQRSTALAHYDICHRVLADELGVEPSRDTVALYNSIRDGKLAPAPAPTERPVPPARSASFTAPVRPPSPGFVAPPAREWQSHDGQGREASPHGPLFVARERELQQLDAHLEQTLAGGAVGQVVLVTGETGSGKTALVNEFVRRAMAAHPELVAARGNCSAQAGVGDPYRPFREILGMLSGDVEPRRAGGALTPEHARRLWDILPSMVRALIQQGPDLVGILIPGADLALRAETYAPEAPWRADLGELVKRRAMVAPRDEAVAPLSAQAALLGQVTRMLRALAQQHPLILVLDDLQWADSSSIGLLFHLGKSLASSRVLLVGAYRPDDVALGRGGERHPLEPVVHELQRDLGDITVDLSQAEGRSFVDALLDAEPNRLSRSFRDTLYRRTGGQALYTVELLRGLKESGDLRRDEGSMEPGMGEAPWVEGPALNWNALPARVDAVIAERVGRLSPECRALLDAASVEGEEFTAEVVARACMAEEGAIGRRLSGELSHPHRLVRAVSLQRLGHRRLARYRFSHFMYQQYLYSHLDEVERARLHEGVAGAMEELYAEQLDEMAAQLAWHWQEAGLADKAAHYMHRAGVRALKLSASEESVAHLTRGVALLQTLLRSPDHAPQELARQELAMQLALAGTLVATQGWGSPERARACVRAYELAREIGEPASALQPCYALADLYIAQGQLRRAVALGDQLLALAQQCQDAFYGAIAHALIGISRTGLGELAAAREHLERATSGFEALGPLAGASFPGAYLSVASLEYLAAVLSAMGYPDRAAQLEQQAVRQARAHDHPMILGYVLIVLGATASLLSGREQMVQDVAEELAALGKAGGVLPYQAWGTILQGWVQSRHGQATQGIARMRHAVADWQAGGAVTGRPVQLLLMADACLHAGLVEQGLGIISEGLAFMEQSETRLYAAEMHRLKGELLESMGHEVHGQVDGEAGLHRAQICYRQAEQCFRQAIAVARQQGARLWELRAALGLARLQRAQGRAEEAKETLAGVYAAFSEGFGIPDLLEARALLHSLDPRTA
jgi:DNA-binding SARP family transcriptional activator